jgi:hypothetical protein
MALLLSVLAGGACDRAREGLVDVTAPDGGVEAPSPIIDAGTALPSPPVDAGIADSTVPPVDAGVPEPEDTGPWPDDPVLDYSARYRLGRVQSVGLDGAQNLWLLDGDRVGVLEVGSDRPVWSRGLGQAAGGFGPAQRALGSTVICGGEAGQAYVGYRTYGLDDAYIAGPGEPGYDPVRYFEFQKGDVDVVALGEDGTVRLVTHLGKTTDTSGHEHLGIRNTNDWHYDEDRSVFTCERVTRGPYRNDVYIGTNHGVTQIRGLVYNSHRHATWAVNGSLRIGYNYGLGIGQNGDVLVANEWMVGILVPNGRLEDFDRQIVNPPVPWRYKGHNTALNSLAEFDFWRAFEQTTDGTYWLGSATYGVWQLTLENGRDDYVRLEGLPTNAITALKATDDGALYIGTANRGLWRREPDGTVVRDGRVGGHRVLQLVYEPGITPTMLLVLTEHGLTVLRGP